MLWKQFQDIVFWQEKSKQSELTFYNVFTEYHKYNLKRTWKSKCLGQFGPLAKNSTKKIFLKKTRLIKK